MTKKPFCLLAIVPTFLAIGCGSAPEARPPTTDTAGIQARKQLSDKLRAIPPSERPRYAKEHPQEMQAALMNFGMGGRPPQKQPQQGSGQN